MVSRRHWASLIFLVTFSINADAIAQTKRMVDLNGDPLPQGAVARLGSYRFWTGGPVAHLAYGQNGKHLVAAMESGSIRLWDVQSGQPIRERETHRGEPLFLACSPQVGPVAIIDNNGLQTWTLSTTLEAQPQAQPMARFGGGRETTNASGFGKFALSPDGNWLAEAQPAERDKAPQIRIARLELDKPLSEFANAMVVPLDVKQILWLAYAADGQSVFAVCQSKAADKGVLMIVDPRQGRILRRLPMPLPGDDQKRAAVAISPTSDMVAIGLFDTKLALLDIKTGKLRIFAGHTFRIRCMAFSPDGKLLASASNDRSVRTWDVASGEVRHESEGPAELLHALIFSPDGKQLAGAGHGSHIHVWDIDSSQKLRSRGGYLEGLQAVDVCDDGQIAATRSMLGEVCLWAPLSGKKLWTIPPENRVLYFALSRDGKFLATASKDRWFRSYVQLWDVAAKKEIRSWQEEAGFNHTSQVYFTPDGKQLLISTNQDFIRAWDVSSGHEVRRYPWPESFGQFKTWALVEDGKTLAVAGEKNTLRLVDLSTSKNVATLKCPDSRPHRLVWSRDGRLLGAETSSETLLFWDVRTRQPIPPLRILQSGEEELLGRRPLFEIDTNKLYGGLSLTPNGRMVLMGDENDLKLLERSSGGLRGTRTGHLQRINDVAVTRDGRLWITVSMDGTGLVWDAVSKHDRASRSESAPVLSDAKSVWQALGQNPRDSYVAVRWLIERPAFSLPLLQKYVDEHLKNEREAEQLVPKLVQNLDSNLFGKRDRADAALEKLGELAAPALQQAVTHSNSLEVKRRAQRLLALLDAPGGSVERLRLLRAIEALEQIDTQEASQIVKKLSHETKHKWLREEAGRSLVERSP